MGHDKLGLDFKNTLKVRLLLVCVSKLVLNLISARKKNLFDRMYTRFQSIKFFLE